MGYETKMIIVERVTSMVESTALIYYPDPNTETLVPPNTPIIKGPWCHVIGVLDLSNCGTMPGICKFKDSDGSFTHEPFDGNKLIGLDSYGDYRKFVPIDEVINLLNQAIHESLSKGETPYRRFAIALALLRTTKEHFEASTREKTTQRKVFWNNPNPIEPKEPIDNRQREIGCLFYGH